MMLSVMLLDATPSSAHRDATPRIRTEGAQDDFVTIRHCQQHVASATVVLYCETAESNEMDTAIFCMMYRG